MYCLQKQDEKRPPVEIDKWFPEQAKNREPG